MLRSLIVPYFANYRNTIPARIASKADFEIFLRLFQNPNLAAVRKGLGSSKHLSNKSALIQALELRHEGLPSDFATA
jgi:hypothetical protein